MNCSEKITPGLSNDRWTTSSPVLPIEPSTKPSPYSPDLTPSPSLLRPHCLARHRLRLWKPSYARNSLDDQGLPINLTAEDLQRIQDVLTTAYAPTTAAAYGSGLLVFHVFCDRKSIPEEQ